MCSSTPRPGNNVAIGGDVAEYGLPIIRAERQAPTIDRGDATIWLIIIVPILIVAGIALTFAVWAWTGPLIALLAFAGLCTVGASVATALQRRNRLG
jgi:hypothetical protein